MPTGKLAGEGKKLWEEIYQKAKKGSCKDQGDRAEECAARTAWTALKQAGWKEDKDGNWTRSKSLTEFSMRIEKAVYDKTSNEYRIRTVASDTEEDNRKDNMSLELFKDFVDRIESNESVPEEYQSDFWKGGEPYISVSHYPDSNGKTVPGIIDATYIDGTYLKSKGKFLNTPLGRKCFEAVCSDLYGETKDREDKIRISIAFLDYMHKHKSNGFVFDRLKSEKMCPECLLEMLSGESKGKIYLKGHLIHEALTRVPVNTRTSMEVDKSMADKVLTRKDDAKSIVGDELADELEEQAEIIGKSEALVIKSEDEAPGEVEDGCIDSVTNQVDPDCVAKKANETPMVDEPEIEVAKEAELIEEATKTEGGAKYPSSDYLVVEDPQKSSTWHLQVKKHGKPDHGLMGAAKAALTSPGGHRGNTYQGPSKSAAISKLKKLYASEKMEWTSEVEESEVDESETGKVEVSMEEIKAFIAETVKSVIKESTPVEPALVHPLDNYFSEFKQKFDEIINSDVDEDAKLHQVQEPFTNLGNGIVSVVKSSIKPKEITLETKSQMDFVEALSKVMNPLNQKLDLIYTQLSTPQMEKPMLPVPQRRSIQPSVVLKATQQPVVQSETPNLRKIIERTT